MSEAGSGGLTAETECEVSDRCVMDSASDTGDGAGGGGFSEAGGSVAGGGSGSDEETGAEEEGQANVYGRSSAALSSGSPAPFSSNAALPSRSRPRPPLRED